MMLGGLCSVTFRGLGPREVVQLASEAGLAGIEWGGDVHVPHGDVARAREVRAITEDAGLRPSSYGSYYRVAPPGDPVPFDAVIETAVALGAPIIRVWAGKLGSVEADEAHRAQVAAEARRIAEQAAEAGVGVAFEYHGGTLTDRVDSAIALLTDAAHPNLGLYWQPRPEMGVEENLAVLTMLAPWLRHLHVFHWQPGEDNAGAEMQRRPLEEGAEDWKQYLAQAAGRRAAVERFALLEFVAGDTTEAFRADARALLRLLDETRAG